VTQEKNFGDVINLFFSPLPVGVNVLSESEVLAKSFLVFNSIVVTALFEETNAAYIVTNEALEKAEMEESNDKQDRVKDRLQHLLNELDTTTKELERMEVERAECKDQLQYLRSELDAIKEELDRRDV
jgi:septal ring factor EnvC (AmiA/AmiB activator)